MATIPSPYRALAGGATTVVVAGASVRQITRNLDAAYPGFWERLVDEERDRIRAGIWVVKRHRRRKPRARGDEVHYLPATGGNL